MACKKRATISADGPWDPASQTVTFTETYSFDDGHTDTLHWVIKKRLARGSMLALRLGLTAKLRASRPDALITGGILGIRASRWGSSSLNFNFDDWFYRIDQNACILRGTAGRAGLPYATAHFTYPKIKD